MAGDWDGNGTSTLGVVNPATAIWYLRNSTSAGAPDVQPFAYGAARWFPLAGQWNGFAVLQRTANPHAFLALTDATLLAIATASPPPVPAVPSPGDFTGVGSQPQVTEPASNADSTTQWSSHHQSGLLAALDGWSSSPGTDELKVVL
jgi:hypothetical protein